MRPNIFRVPSLRNNSRLRPHRTISIQLMLTIGLIIRLALSTLQTGVRLRTNTHTRPLLDKCNLRSNSDCSSDDFYTPLLDSLSSLNIICEIG